MAETDQTLKKTPLAEAHQQLGGKMVPFGGWFMPVQYSGLVDEHTTVRTKVGLFDVSHMGEVRIQGEDALAFTNYLTVNNVTKLEDDQAHYSAFCTPEGTVVDDLLVYREAADNFLLVINAANIEKDVAWIRKNQGNFKVTITNESDDTAQIAIQGPLAQGILQRVCDADLSEMKYYWFKRCKVGPVSALVSRTGYTGEDGFECYVAAADAVAVWRLLLETGAEEGIKPAGLGARDSLRLEARMHLYGNDMDETTTVLEAGLGWIVKTKNTDDFIGKAAIVAQKKAGVERKLVGFRLLGRGIARPDCAVIEDGIAVGRVTSGTQGPTLKQSIGMAYVPTHLSRPGTTLQIQIRNKLVDAEVVKGPFYKRA
ncbi:glycine cleavage system aminomethyltransferase GcvT [Acanthopleuribacter pedis]|uniref:Aminomethyltransferase n=1 Tax=Acanthopleuribacter pedis TaxID=442870 RepID=A0A8J7QKW1_9BACT|nr:glycine cleavage system aminomethyltransferase GcvT [Acanthopleuribacter pedis]MBO1320108.1 glycine cleavage system aminomethyltransferase GcvT [Acanthopleuribacter pedis]